MITSDETELKMNALLAFERFAEVWDFNDFWKRGNTFDACLVFAWELDERWPDEPSVNRVQERISGMLAENMAYFKRFDPGGLWADDFGWWGLMALNARKHLKKEGDMVLADAYWSLATELCWEYKKKTAYDYGNDAKPVAHGCRNGDANGQSMGVKNTVTNVLLFLLSIRIYRGCREEKRKGGEKYLVIAYRQWLWFSSWFELDDYEYFKKIDNDAALVQERPMAEFEGSDYQSEIHPPWAKGWVWSGDQGMLLAAMSDMLSTSQQLTEYLEMRSVKFDQPAFEKKLSSCIRMLASGVEKLLVGKTDDIIREAPCESSFGPTHGNDYLAGRGIMMRYLGELQETDLLGVDFFKPLSATAKAIWKTRDPASNQFQPEFTLPENDLIYIERFRSIWGTADDVLKWDLTKMPEANKNGVSQSIGLDALGAVIRSRSPKRLISKR